MGVSGYNELSALGHRLREAGDSGLMKELTKGLRDGIKPLSKTIRDWSPRYTPRDYEITFAKSLRFRTKVNTRGTTAAVDFVVTAMGKANPRKIKEINAGMLRHPVHGRYRRTRHGRKKNPWVAQRIRAGFFDEPVEDDQDFIREQMHAAMARVTAKITNKKE